MLLRATWKWEAGLLLGAAVFPHIQVSRGRPHVHNKNRRMYLPIQAATTRSFFYMHNHSFKY